MSSDFKIHAICVVKNEVDIIEACLRSAEQWADRIIVYDNKSDDGTWEARYCQKLCIGNRRILAKFTG